MDASLLIAGMITGTIAASFIEPTHSNLYDIDLMQLAEIWTRERVSPRDPYSLKHRALTDHLRTAVAEYPDTLSLETVGSSVEGRAVYLVSAGRGPNHILFWSQMHGDEPTATNALIDLFHFLGRHDRESWVAEILQTYTLLFIPMLNPDGAERNQRRNVMELDINRDARMLQSAEGRLLRKIRDRYDPFLGFNLHNQSSLTTVGDTGAVATIALLAVAADDQPTSPVNPGSAGDHLLTKRVSAVLYEALSQFIPGHLSRYDESFNPRAFGDNMTLWGTPTVLIESGGYTPGHRPDFTVQLNFVGILAALNSLASGKIRNADPSVFDALKMNSETPIFDLILRDAWIFTGRNAPLFRGDLAIRHNLRSEGGAEAIIADVGDLGVFTGHRTLDCSGALVTPGLIAWSPEQTIGSSGRDTQLLRAGVTTVIETARWDRISRELPAPEAWEALQRPINWSYLIADAPRRAEKAGIELARWMAAGSRAWVGPTNTAAVSNSRLSEIAGWFGIELLSFEDASRYEVPAAPKGDPVSALLRWTSDAAKRFRIPRRGRIELGSVADLVIWRSASARAPADMRDYRPEEVILNGHVLNLQRPEPYGRFFGR